ncbi:MAG: hypothetical protein ACTHLW_01075 [Verrucomicrobiota bacterium]
MSPKAAAAAEESKKNLSGLRRVIAATKQEFISAIQPVMAEATTPADSSELDLLRSLAEAVFGTQIAVQHGSANERSELVKLFFQSHLKVPGISFEGIEAWRQDVTRITGLARVQKAEKQQTIDEFFKTLDGQASSGGKSRGAMAARHFQTKTKNEAKKL